MTPEQRALCDRARRDVEEGHVPACQVALARAGELELFETFGDATADTRFVVFSATKPFVAAAVWQLVAEGTLRWDEPVAALIPEFATHGKDAVTLDHLMLHTAGFPTAPLGPPAWWTRQGRRERFARWRLNWEPGTRFEYHPTSAHWVLAELIEVVTGRDYRDVIEARVSRPAGIDHRVLGAPVEHQDGVAPIVETGEPPTAEELRALLGIDALPETEVTNEALLAFNDPKVRALGVPGGGGVMTAADLARFSQLLLHDPDGVFDPAVLADATGTVRNTFPDPLLGVPANRTRGLVMAGDDGLAPVRGFGHGVGPRAFGHNGAMGQIAWADPDRDLSFAYVTSGRDNHVIREWRRSVALSSLAARC